MLHALRETTGDVGSTVGVCGTACLTLFECVHLCAHVDASDAQHTADFREATLHEHTHTPTTRMRRTLEQPDITCTSHRHAATHSV